MLYKNLIQTLPTTPFISHTYKNIPSNLVTFNPASGLPLTSLAQTPNNLLDEAFLTAQKAQSSYQNTSPAFRQNLLLQISRILKENKDKLSLIETLDSGKPISQSHEDLKCIIDTFNYFSGHTYLQGRNPTDYSSTLNCQTRREPLGVLGLITPWNYPLMQAVWKLAPALATGNSLILKPSEHSSLTCLYLGELLKDVIPKGVLQVISGDGAIGKYLGELELDGVNFTGSSQTGAAILGQSAKKLRKTGVELGGKSCSVVAKDADLDKAVEAIFWGCMYNMGQNCVASTRVLVQEEVYEKFCEKLKFYCMENVKVGDPLQEDVNFGPLNNQIQFNKCQSYIQKAEQDKLDFLVHPQSFDIPKQGYYQAPCIVKNVSDSHALAQEEIFGPVLSILKPFKDDQEAVQRANDSIYGLGAAIFTRDMSLAEKYIRNLQAGTVWVNTYNLIPVNMPFGGYKQSGFSREVGEECLEEYTQVKSVYYDLS